MKLFKDKTRTIPGLDLFDWFNQREQIRAEQNILSPVLLIDGIGDHFWDIILKNKLDMLANAMLSSEIIIPDQNFRNAAELLLSSKFFSKKTSSKERTQRLIENCEIFERRASESMLSLDPAVIANRCEYAGAIIPLLSEEHQIKIAYRIRDLCTVDEIHTIFYEIYNICYGYDDPIMARSAQHILLDRLEPLELASLIENQPDTTQITFDMLEYIRSFPLPPRDEANPCLDTDGSEWHIISG